MDDDSYTINSLKEAIDFFLENAKLFPQKETKMCLMYRGHSSEQYLLQPSIFRKERLENEAVLFQELKRISPSDFPSSNSDIENLIKMQHYGLPTRLLDFSLNPLVALYFACQTSKDEKYKNDNGEIIALYSGIKQIDAIEVERCARLISYQGATEKAFQTKMKINEPLSGAPSKNNEWPVNQSVMKKYFPNSFYFIPAIHNNERISRQNGVFMLFGHFYKTQTPFEKKPFMLQKKVVKEFNPKLRYHFLIPPEKKEEILFELDVIGINHAFLFPELEHQAFYIDQKYLRKAETKPIKKKLKVLHKSS